MGIVDWLRKLLDPGPPPKPSGPKRRPAKHSTGRPTQAPLPASSPARRSTATSPSHAAKPRPDDARWVAPNELLELKGLAIRGGLVYVGSRLSAGYGQTEPSLIDPTLPVTFAPQGSPTADLPYWPSYASMTPEQRGAYLRWLAGGRRDPGIPVGYPFVLLYGLERRLHHDRTFALQTGELPAIRSELAALQAVYGPTNERFQATCEQVIGLVDLVQVDHVLAQHARDGSAILPISAKTLPPPPPLLPANTTPPLSLRIGLGLFALARVPLSPEWALAWAWHAPEVRIRTPAIRCPEELKALFAIRYQERYGDGLVLDPAAFGRLTVEVQPANMTLGTRRIASAILPDVMARAGAYRPLTALVPAMTEELDAYSRWLGRHADRAGSLAAWATLPEALADLAAPPVATAADRLAALVGAEQVAVVSGDTLLRIWTGERAAPPEKLPKGEITSFTDALARLGYGIEPDPRSGTPLTASGTVGLFRLPPEAADSTTAIPNGSDDGPYEAAAMLIQLAAFVGEADGKASIREFAAVREVLRSLYPLTPAAYRRLGARLAWLASRPIGERTLAGMKKRIAPFPGDARDRLALGLLRIVDADGAVSPSEVAALRKIWPLFGRSPDRVASDLHAVMTGGQIEPAPASGAGRPAEGRRGISPRSTSVSDEPVIVRRATPETPGVRIPPPPQPHPSSGHSAPEPDIALDPDAIAQKIADSAAVSALLGDLLADEAPQQAEGDATGDPEPRMPRPVALSPAAAILQDLGRQDVWPADAFATLAESHGMLPNAAIDLLNDLGFDHAGEPLLIEEPDGSVAVDPLVHASILEMTSPPGPV